MKGGSGTNAKQSFKNLTDKGEVCLSTTILAGALLAYPRHDRWLRHVVPPPGLRRAMLAPPVAPSVSLVGLWRPRSGRSVPGRPTDIYGLRSPAGPQTVNPIHQLDRSRLLSHPITSTRFCKIL